MTKIKLYDCNSDRNKAFIVVLVYSYMGNTEGTNQTPLLLH